MIKKKMILRYPIGLFSIILFLCQCTIHSPQFKRGMELYKSGDYDKSIEYFQKALKQHPERKESKTMLFRSKLSSYYNHLALAKTHRNKGRKKEAVSEYKIALSIFPNNIRLRDEFNSYVNKEKIKKVEKFKSSIKPPVVLKVKTEEKINLNLRNTPVSKIFKAIGKSFNVNFLFDKDFRDFLYSLELENIGFYEVLNQLCMVANLRYRVIDSLSILLYQNTAMKKKNFDLRGIKVFYLGNILAEDAKKLVMTLFRDQQIMLQEEINLNALIVKASEDTLREIEQFILKIDKEKNEVEIDVEILEVGRNFLKKIGIDYGTTPFTLSSGTVSGGEEGENSTINTTVNWTDLSNLNFFLTIPTVALNIMETDSENKLIARPNLRGLEGEEIKFMVGEELPIPQTQWQAIAAGGVANSPVTSYQYKNVGVEVTVTPFIHANNEVTLRIKFTLKFVTSYIDSFPVLGKRELENVIRLKEGETNIIGGFIQDEVRGSLSGIPALSKVPVLGLLFGANEKTIKQTDLIFSITPRIIRKIDTVQQDLEPIWTNVRTGNQSQPEIRQQRSDFMNRRASSVKRESVIVSPARRRIPVNNVGYFTIRLNSSTEISTLSLGGSVSGGNATIKELKTDFFKSDDVKILEDYSANSFDLGFSFLGKAVKNTILVQLKVKFLKKGDYTITIDSVNAYNKDREQIEIGTSKAEVEVY
ncbi:MAG: tetratricopeptide repeat protein [Candidatus Aminicenantes bacterium]|nr:tetratricopeptide repeat protein [Candidatus Aminicenantes bacterium]